MLAASVNGYPCRDSTDVGYAAMHINPVHPSYGPHAVRAPPWSADAKHAEREAAETALDRRARDTPVPSRPTSADTDRPPMPGAAVTGTRLDTFA